MSGESSYCPQKPTARRKSTTMEATSLWGMIILFRRVCTQSILLAEFVKADLCEQEHKIISSEYIVTTNKRVRKQWGPDYGREEKHRQLECTGLE